MIVQKMSADEVIRTLQRDDDYILERMKGLNIKNSKKLKSKFVKNNDIMSKSTYNIQGTNDTVVLYAIKLVQTIKGKEYSTMMLNYYVKTYYNTYIIPSINSKTQKVDLFVEFSIHSVERMKERLGKDFETFFEEDYLKNNGIIQPVEYLRNGDENEFVAHVGDAFIILEQEDSGKKYMVKTVLSEELLYNNQVSIKLDSKEATEKIWAEILGQLDNQTEVNLKQFKKNGLIKAA